MTVFQKWLCKILTQWTISSQGPVQIGLRAPLLETFQPTSITSHWPGRCHMATSGCEGGREDKTPFSSIRWNMAREQGLEKDGRARQQADWSVYLQPTALEQNCAGIWSTGWARRSHSYSLGAFRANGKREALNKYAWLWCTPEGRTGCCECVYWGGDLVLVFYCFRRNNHRRSSLTWRSHVSTVSGVHFSWVLCLGFTQPVGQAAPSLGGFAREESTPKLLQVDAWICICGPAW